MLPKELLGDTDFIICRRGGRAAAVRNIRTFWKYFNNDPTTETVQTFHYRFFRPETPEFETVSTMAIKHQRFF